MTMNAKRLVVAALMVLCLSTTAAADAIIKIDLGGAGTDVSYVNGVLSTSDDGVAGTTGNQDTGVDFVGSLSFLSDILSGASFTLAGVTASGLATVVANLVIQPTTGGSFDLYAADNTLLLSGALNDGAITAGLGQSTGSFFNVTAASFTGGTLLAYVAPTPAGLSLALSGLVNEFGGVGLAVAQGCSVGECELQDFSGAADGLIDGNPVPEPASMVLLMSGLLAVFRRKQEA